MVICPRCGAKNGQRNPNPVKCCRCWYLFERPTVEQRVVDAAVDRVSRESPVEKLLKQAVKGSK